MEHQSERTLIQNFTFSHIFPFFHVEMKHQPERALILRQNSLDSIFDTVEMEPQPGRAFSGNSYHKKVVYVYHRKDVALLLRSKGVADK